jgi:hypothetical protein
MYDPYSNTVQEPDESQIQPQTQEDCTQGDSILENDIQVITKIEKITDFAKYQIINNKLTEFKVAKNSEKYSQNIHQITQPPSPVDIATINTGTPTCNIIPDTQSTYFLCKYPDIGKRTLSEYIKEVPKNIQRILDQHDQILKTISNLANEKKLIHHAIQDTNIIVKSIDDIPMITNFKQAAFLYYEEAMNIDNFETIVITATEIHCLEAHILVYLGNKKRQQTQSQQSQWKSTKYDQQQHTEAIQSHSQSSNQYPEYIDKTYEEVYRAIAKTFSKWDIYCITKMFLNILSELQQQNLELSKIESYKSTLEQLLSKKTFELPNTLQINNEILPIQVEPSNNPIIQ